MLTNISLSGKTNAVAQVLIMFTDILSPPCALFVLRIDRIFRISSLEISIECISLSVRKTNCGKVLEF